MSCPKFFGYERSTPGTRLACGVVAGIFVFFMALNNLQYSIWGKDATATVTGLAICPRDLGKSHWTELQVKYSYTDADGVVQNNTYNSDIEDWKKVPEVGDSIPMQYLTDGGSRLGRTTGEGSVVVLVIMIFLGCLWWYYQVSESE